MYTQNYPYSLQKYEKNSKFAALEFANNFIAGIQFLAHRLAIRKLAMMQVPRNTPHYPYSIEKYEKNSNFAAFEIANNFIAGIQFLAHRIGIKKIGNDASTAEHTPNYPYSLEKYGKNSNFAAFEIANNFIAGIQFLAHTLAIKKLATMQAPRNTFNHPHSPSKIAKKNLTLPFLRSPIILLPEYHF